MKTDIKEPIKRLMNHINHHINDSTFKMKWKLDGAICVKCHSLAAKNKEEALRYSVSKAIVAIVKILKQCSDNPTQFEVLKRDGGIYRKNSYAPGLISIERVSE